MFGAIDFLHVSLSHLIKYLGVQVHFNPILTGLYWEQVFPGGGGGGGLQVAAPKRPIVSKFRMDVKTHEKCIVTHFLVAENCLSIIIYGT